MSGATLPRLVLVLTLLGTLLYAAADDSWGVLLLVAPLVLVGSAITGRPGAKNLPRGVGLALVLGVVAWAGTLAMDGRVDVSAFCRLTLVVLVIKFFDRRKSRDFAQMLVLLGFLGVAATLLSPRLLVGVLLVLYVPLLAWSVVAFQFHVAGEYVKNGAIPGANPVAAGEAPGTGPVLSRGSRRSLVMLSLACLALSAGVASAVFVIVPRGLGRDFFMRMGRYQGQVTGFSDRVRLGEAGIISQSSAVAMDVELRDGNGRLLGGPSEIFYMRGAVLDEYRSGEWRPGPRERRTNQRQPANLELRFAGPAEEGQQITQIVTLRSVPSEDTYLFTLWRPNAITLTEETPVSIDSGSSTIEVTLPPGRFRYRVTSELGVHTPRGDVDAIRPRVNFPSRPIRDLTQSVLQRAAIEADPSLRPRARDAEAARAIENFLRSEFNYSLEMRRAPANADPIEWFLDESNRTGHCEYFASAMTAMCRSAGIPARVVTGYVLAEWNAQTNTYIARQSHAHAWVEAEVQPNVWREYDPTPPADLREIHLRQPSLASRVGRFFESLEYLWITSIVSFDEADRSRIMGRDTSPRDALSGDELRNRARQARRVFSSLLVGVIFFLAIYVAGRVGLVFGKRWLPNRVPRSPQGWAKGDAALAGLASQARFYDELIDVMRRRRQPKPDWRPVGDHAESMEAADPALAHVGAPLSRLYYALRFGRRPLTEPEQAELNALLASLRTLPPAPGPRARPDAPGSG